MAEMLVLVIQNISISADRSSDSIVHILTSYALESLGFKTQQGQEISLLKNFQTGSWVHTASYWMGTGVLSQG
jgi:hypothetical protein